MEGVLADTICAVATPTGEGGIGIVRISGPAALSVARKVVRLRSNQSLEKTSSHTLHLADVLSASTLSTESLPVQTEYNDRVIDEGLVVYMKAPRSFTAEDVVEIHCHGSLIVLKRVCEACLAAGARMAEPGEFTKRAFLNGRLDLSQAEAVLDTIKAKSELGLKQAQRQLRGELGQMVDQLRTRLIGLLARIEAGIDFSEEDLTFIGSQELILSLQKTLDDIDRLLLTAKTGRVLREGVRVVIVGQPNVGKSSLLNSLLRENRAIVTDIPGTTRDVIEESVIWDGLSITLIDTAGLRETVDVVEREGIRRSKLAQEESDVVLHLLDAGELQGHGCEPYLGTSLAPEDLVVINKCDLIDSQSAQRLCESIRGYTKSNVLPISVVTGAGLEKLRQAIVSHFSSLSLEPHEGVTVTNLRHQTALERARSSLHETLTSTRNGMDAEFIAMDLRGAADALGEVTGVITTDDILNRIFSEFCIGK